MPDLLIIACSARKRREPLAPVAAIERYDGVFFRVLRKWLRNVVTQRLDVLIVSAQFGLIEGDAPIPEYDRRMTPGRALELAPDVQVGLRRFLAQRRYRRMFVNLGKDYEFAVAGLAELKRAVWARGAIGQRARQMKQWLEGIEGCR